MPPDITVTLLFVRTAPWDKTAASPLQIKHIPGAPARILRRTQVNHFVEGEKVMDTQESLPLRSGRVLFAVVSHLSLAPFSTLVSGKVPSSRSALYAHDKVI